MSASIKVGDKILCGDGEVRTITKIVPEKGGKYSIHCKDDAELGDEL